jgi:hypothetical protein
MLMTLARACEAEFADYDLKKLTDDRTILRRETGLDFLTPGDNGRLALDLDDVAALCGYADLRRSAIRYPVKLAGSIMARVRAAMRDYPDEPQFTVVQLANGSVFVLPTSMLDLSSGFTSGTYLLAATIIDARNLRDRVQRAVEAYQPESEREDEAA